MNWYEQKTNEYKQPVAKQLLNSPGKGAWYAAYGIIKQIIHAHMDDDVNEWGYVPEEETIENLAEKCALSVDEFRSFLAFCDTRFILEKRNGRLFCAQILEEKSEYAKKIERRVRRISLDIPDKPSTDDVSVQSGLSGHSVLSDVTTQHNTITTQKEINILPIAHAPAPKKISKPKGLPPTELTEVQRVVKYLSEKTKTEFPNFGKQAKAWKEMHDKDFQEKHIKFAIDVMAEDPFWRDNGFDLTNVMNNIAKIRQRYSRRDE